MKLGCAAFHQARGHGVDPKTLEAVPIRHEFDETLEGEAGWPKREWQVGLVGLDARNRDLKLFELNLNRGGFPWGVRWGSFCLGERILSAPLPLALRTRFQRLIEEGLSGRAALRLKVSPATGARWARQVRIEGNAEPVPQEPPRGRGKLALHRAFFEEPIAQEPDIALFELRDALAEAEGVHRSP
ncbi:MAG: hypothetical protein GDA36_14255 [Rhodobacteraceae bacterium]|nr:hypothetical protein [Paracoccaceae bacterium]